MLCGQNVLYQQAGAISVTTGGPIGSGFGLVSADMAGGVPSVTGRPFSGTEQRHSLQVLGDGTRIERTETSQVSRDSEGRTRTETTLPAGSNGHAMVTIQDPVAGTTYILDPVQKTANKLPLPKGAGSFSFSTGAVSSAARLTGPAPPPMTAQIVTMEASSEKAASAPADEDLGAQIVNGVQAKGTRTTIDIPAGQIGNDRAFQVVSERWYSEDLQKLVKSSNSDPRFGTTTYEITNINRAEPDPTSFQVPSDYTVQEGNAFFNTIQTK